MIDYRAPRILERLTSRIPETKGLDIEQATALARTAASCITLSDADVEPFQASLPMDAPDYHSYHDLTELIWRNYLSREDMSRNSRVSAARSSSTYIWRNLIREVDPKLYNIMVHPNDWPSTYDFQVGLSVLRRTTISDPTVYDLYLKLREGSIQNCIGKTSVSYVQMLLASSHSDLLDLDWPDDVLEFM